MRIKCAEHHSSNSKHPDQPVILAKHRARVVTWWYENEIMHRRRLLMARMRYRRQPFVCENENT